MTPRRLLVCLCLLPLFNAGCDVAVVQSMMVNLPFIGQFFRPDLFRPLLRVESFSPMEGYQGTLVKIKGSNFSANRLENQVKIGTVSAFVISASTTEIEALVGFGATDGPVEVTNTSSTLTATAADNFKLLKWPERKSGKNGPPIFYAGAGTGGTGGGASPTAGDLPSTGTIRVLVIPCYPTDVVPGNMVTASNTIGAPWADVQTFYNQASYTLLTVNVTEANFVALTGNWDDYYEPNYSNIDPDVLDRLTAECAKGAQDQGINLNNFDAMACVIWTNGVFLRAWGGWSKSNFAYAGSGLNINITVGHEINQMALGEIANWGRCAHELGHNIIHAGLVLGEDVYRSDMIDPDTSATAASFDMMGSHDSHPLFSGAYMHQLGWFNAGKIVELNWDRNPFTAQYRIAAHRTTQDADPNNYHLVRIKVADGLYYFIETRQMPSGGDAQIFDTNIPLGGAPNNGGVVVTKVLTDVVNNNQQMRFITLLHPQEVMTVGDIATDPARALTIRVLSEQVSGGRLISTVRVEWAQELTPDPNADFNLRIEPWGAGYETFDIWIDRQPWGTFDHTDANGDATGNGDQPQPMAINHFWARIRDDGNTPATNVRVTYYAVTPPGVGDNGNWTSIADTVIIPTIAGNGFEERFVNWTPTVGEHTCLKVFIEGQLGELTYGDNSAQENVFEFTAPAHSPPEPFRFPVAVRNPLREPSIILVKLTGVPSGWIVQLPYHWVYLDALGEIKTEAIAIPTGDVDAYQHEKLRPLNLKIAGNVPRQYTEEVGKTFPGSRMLPIGGITARITPKYGAKIEIREDQEFAKSETKIGIRGTIDPPESGQAVQVLLTDPKNRVRAVDVTTNASGVFVAVFDLTLAPTEDPIHGTPGRKETPPTGDYRAIASIISAASVAEAVSNELKITR